jgi:glucose-1-phosphate cytidylyltransferase
LNREVKNFIKSDQDPFEAEPLLQITKNSELMAYKHEDFWAPVDTLREKMDLEKLWEFGHPPWLSI